MYTYNKIKTYNETFMNLFSNAWGVNFDNQVRCKIIQLIKSTLMIKYILSIQ